MTLEEATIQDMFAEITRRCASVILLAQIVDDNDAVTTRTLYAGDEYACIGMMDFGREAMFGVLRKRVRPARPADSEEEDEG